MIRIFTGDDRVKAGLEIKKILGDKYEVVDCAELTPGDLPAIFLGASLFSAKRKILLRDLSANGAVWSEIEKYLNTPHEVILLETKLDKRTVTYKNIKDQVEIREFKLADKTDFRAVYNIYSVAKRDGVKAVAELLKVKDTEEPIQFMGLLTSRALKDYQNRPGVREKKVLKLLSEADMQMKTSKIDPWMIVESVLLRLSKV